jgi:hypothetical protein
LGFGGNGAEDVGLELGVDLDLLEMVVGVEIDDADGLGGGVGVEGAEG